ncbi:MAG TPA: hypothetical protein VFY06_15765, partial [Verrucomicrobiae bacterium]|nr:hypothetical protein [Verrucomicrobiae bacterium]
MKKHTSRKSQLPPSLKIAETAAERATSNPSLPHTWSIVLAGGEGERLRALTKRWLGKHRPKQYCAFVGNRS